MDVQIIILFMKFSFKPIQLQSPIAKRTPYIQYVKENGAVNLLQLKEFKEATVNQ